MKIIREDENTLMFEEHPNANPNKKALLTTIILVLLFSFVGSFKSIDMSELLFAVVIWSFIFCMFFMLGQKFTIKVRIDKKMNLVSISGFLPQTFSWERKPVEIPINLIKKIEYDTWKPYPLYLINFITTLGALIFILHDDSKVKLRAYSFLVSYKNYGDIGKKIAQYINVPFEM
jgi:hypothetical protein